MVGGTFFIAQGIDDDALAAANSASHDCAKIAGDLNCSSVWGDVYHARTANIQYGLWGFSAAEAAIWLVLALILFAVVYWSVRWVVAGRKKASRERGA